jgi:hypothetical protein
MSVSSRSSVLDIFGVLFYLLYVFMCDQRQCAAREEQVQRFEEEKSNKSIFWLEKDN